MLQHLSKILLLRSELKWIIIFKIRESISYGSCYASSFGCPPSLLSWSLLNFLSSFSLLIVIQVSTSSKFRCYRLLDENYCVSIIYLNTLI